MQEQDIPRKASGVASLPEDGKIDSHSLAQKPADRHEHQQMMSDENNEANEAFAAQFPGNEEISIANVPIKDWPLWMGKYVTPVGNVHEVLFANFSSWMDHFYPAIWDGFDRVHLPRDEHKAARKKLTEDCRTHPKDMETLAGWWDAAVNAGNHIKAWAIPLLPTLVNLTNKKPAFVRSDMQLLRSFRAMEDEFEKLCIGEHASVQLPWMVLTSAIVRGGVTWKKMLCAIAALAPEALRGAEGRLEVRLDLHISKDYVRTQIWYPDRITSTLLVRWLFGSDVQQSQRLLAPDADDKRFAATLKMMFKTLALPSMKAKDLLRAARVNCASKLSGFSSAYLAGDLRSDSLPPQVYHHTNGWVSTEEPTKKQSSTKRGSKAKLLARTSQFVFDPLAEPQEQFDVIDDFRNILRKKDQETSETKGKSIVDKVHHRLEKGGAALWPITHLLGLWLLWRLGEELIEGDVTTRIKEIMASTSYNYLGLIAESLITVFWQYDISQLEEEQFGELYEAASELCDTESQVPIYWMCARSFHTFLTLHRDIPDILFEELDGFTTHTEQVVTSNVVHEREYNAFLSELLKNGTPPMESVQMMLIVVTILGFRCGLRRREIHLMWMSQIHPGAFPMLLVRASILSTLKTFSASRRIPLWAVMPKEELQLLMGYWKFRKENVYLSNALMFSYLETPTTALPQSMLFDPITQAFNEILGHRTPTFRFQQLRHSFANWLLLAMFAIFLPSIAKSRSIMVKYSLIQQKELVEHLRSVFFPLSTNGKGAITRKILHQLAALLGHLSPTTTLKHYVHIIDWIVAHEIEFAELYITRVEMEAWSPSGLENLCGLRHGMAYKAPYAALRDDPMEFLSCFIAQKVPESHKHVAFALVHQHAAMKPINLDHIVASLPEPKLPGLAELLAILMRALERNELNSSSQQNNIKYIGSFEYLELVNWQTNASRQRIPVRAVQMLLAQYVSLYQCAELTSPVLNVDGASTKTVPIPQYPSDIKERKSCLYVFQNTADSFAVKKRRQSIVDAAAHWLKRGDVANASMRVNSSFDDLMHFIDGLEYMGIESRNMSVQLIPSEDAGCAVIKLPQSSIEMLIRKNVNWDADKDIRDGTSSFKGWFLLCLVGNHGTSNGDPRVSDKGRNVQSDSSEFSIAGSIVGLNYASLWVGFVLNIWTYM